MRTIARFLCAAAFLPAFALPIGSVAQAQTVDLHGYAEAALVDAPKPVSWVDGGLGKLPWEGTGSSGRTSVELTGLVLQGRVTLPADLTFTADLRYAPRQKAVVDALDAFMAWHPAPSGAWSWSAKLGSFFPPFGLENTDLGWSSPWTVTNAALDGWVGEELRTNGGEFTLRRQIDSVSVGLTGAVFGWNDAGGVLIAGHGWDVGGRPLGLFDHQRLPDVSAEEGTTPPVYSPVFRETDDQPGYYAGANIAAPDFGKFQVYRNDNRTTLATERADVYGWRTKFWDVGFTRALGPFYVIAEGIIGNTAISPDGDGPYQTDFYNASILGGWTGDPWRVALRLEQFGTSGTNQEHGHEATVSASWSPLQWLRLTAEVVVVDSYRDERRLIGLSPHSVETEPLLAFRGSF